MQGGLSNYHLAVAYGKRRALALAITEALPGFRACLLGPGHASIWLPVKGRVCGLSALNNALPYSQGHDML